MDDITTSLEAMLGRVVDQTVDIIAQDGLRALKSILDSSGFSQFENLKNYEVYAHVKDTVIEFEILVSFSSLDEDSSELFEGIESQEEDDSSTRTFGVNPAGTIGRLFISDDRRDARTSSRDGRRDARKPVRQARDKRTTSRDREIIHQVRSMSARSLKINRTGKLSVRMKNTIKNNREDDGITFTNRKYHGIINDFVEKIKKIIAENFSPEISRILERKIG